MKSNQILKQLRKQKNQIQSRIISEIGDPIMMHHMRGFVAPKTTFGKSVIFGISIALNDKRLES